jgi:hypothetical protein
MGRSFAVSPCLETPDFTHCNVFIFSHHLKEIADLGDGSLKEEEKKKVIMETIAEGRKMEAYAEHRTKDMHVCWTCGVISYKKKPMKQIGGKWICIDCLRQLKEVFDTFDQWEEELSLERDAKKQLDEGMGL